LTIGPNARVKEDEVKRRIKRRQQKADGSNVTEQMTTMQNPASNAPAVTGHNLDAPTQSIAPN
jgi:hypothetical protein